MYSRRAPTGHALLVTVVLLAFLSIALTAVFVTQGSAVRSGGEMIGRRKAFYVCDGINRSMVKLAQEYLATVATPDGAELASYVCTNAGMGDCSSASKLPTLTPPGFTVTDFQIDLGGTSETRPLPSGPFEGMNARQTPVSLRVRAESNASGHACSAEQTIVLAQVGLFQFFVFAEEFVDIYNPPYMVIDGRVHVNGDFCGFGNTSDSSALYIKRLTASGRVFMGSSSCPRARFDNTGSRGINFWDGSAWKWMDKDNDHGCTGCTGGWANYALSRWGGNVQDEAHNVPVLKVPVSGDPPMQDGLNMLGDVQNNAKTQRFLVDPPLFDTMPVDPTVNTDASEVRRQKFACKADLRIINGVWYKRTPGDEDCSDWPGTPIWSDHPGRFAVTASEEEGVVRDQTEIGQRDIAENLGWGLGSRPRRYSYYEADNDGLLIDDGLGVVSYGNLYRDGSSSPPVWRPGMWVRRSTGHSSSFCGGASSNASLALRDTETFQCNCSGGSCSSAHRPANRLQATRGGFLDRRVDYGTSGGEEDRKYILPMNFDVAQFAGALQATGSGELGDHFVGDGFNGIVWISSTWDGQLDGFGNNGNNSSSKKLAALWPNPRAVAAGATGSCACTGDLASGNGTCSWTDSVSPQPTCSSNSCSNGNCTSTGCSSAGACSVDNQPAHVDGSKSTGLLPYPLCSDDIVGQEMTDMSANNFRVPACATTSRPSALRIINSYTVDPVAFPKGLTIATNLPAYVVGDFNKNSADDPSEWRPALVAADAVTLLSSAYNDTELAWADTDDLGDSSREATGSHYQIALLTGDVSTAPGGDDQPTRYGGGINNFPRFLEHWSGKDTWIRGSMVMGFRSVYHRQRFCVGNMSGCDTYMPPGREWAYDTNFDVITNQPPGAPIYEVQAVRRWRRR